MSKYIVGLLLFISFFAQAQTKTLVTDGQYLRIVQDGKTVNSLLATNVRVVHHNDPSAIIIKDGINTEYIKYSDYTNVSDESTLYVIANKAKSQNSNSSSTYIRHIQTSEDFDYKQYVVTNSIAHDPLFVINKSQSAGILVTINESLTLDYKDLEGGSYSVVPNAPSFTLRTNQMMIISHDETKTYVTVSQSTYKGHFISVDDLRAVPSNSLVLGSYTHVGAVLYVYNSNSTAEESSTVVKPTDRTGPGRWETGSVYPDLLSLLIADTLTTGGLFPPSDPEGFVRFDKVTNTLYKKINGVYTIISPTKFRDGMILDVKVENRYRWDKGQNLFLQSSEMEENETLILSENSWGGSTNHSLLNGKTWTDIKNTYDKIRISAYSPRYTDPSEPVAWGYTVDVDAIRNGVNLLEATDNGVASLRIADISTGDIYNHSSAMAASDVKIYGVKKQKTVLNPTSAIVPSGLKMALLKGTTNGATSEDISFTLPAGKELIGISSVLIDFNAGAVTPDETGIIDYNVMKKNATTLTIQGKTEHVQNKPYRIVILIANQ